MLSKRTKLSLCQYLSLQTPLFLSVLFEKHGMPAPSGDYQPQDILLEMLRLTLRDVPEEQVHSLLQEVVQTDGDLRSRVSPRYRYDQRWDDLVRCLLLDGYKIEDRSLVAVDPTIEGAAPVEDDLTTELRQSMLSEREEIIRLLESSANSFRRVPPDYNACLADVRVALQTLVTGIAKIRNTTHPGSFDETRWGQVLAYLRTSALITKPEEDGLSGVFSFVSPGAHIPVGLSDEEIARLGRSLTVSMCYFIAKRFAQGR